MTATINEFFFSIFLFSIYFCVIFVLVYQQKNLLIANPETSETSSKSNLEFDENNFLPSEKLAEEVSKETSRILEIDTSTNERVVPEVKEDIRESEQHNKLYMQAEIIINNLNKRQSHKLD